MIPPLPPAIKRFIPVEYDPFLMPDISLAVPAIQPQMEIFASCVIGEEDANRAYNESVSLRLHGRFHQQAMFSALQDVVHRHESLRATFTPNGSDVLIYKKIDLRIFFQDLSEKNTDEQQKFIDDFKHKDSFTSFDLLNGPLFRVALFKLREDEHYLNLVAHHIICDGWSFGVIIQDLSKYYSMYAKGDKFSLPEPPQCSQYAIEQLKFMDSEEYKKIENYWIDMYKKSIPVLSLPTDFERPLKRTYKSQRKDFEMDQEMVASIKNLGSKAGCSFVTTLVSLFALYLHSLSEQDDIVVGLPAAGQSVTGHYGLVGHCVNLLPLRFKIDKDDTFGAFLAHQKRVILDAFDHQSFTFGRLLQKLSVPRDPSRIPLVPIGFNMDVGMDNGVAFEGLRYELISDPRPYETFEIFVNASGSERKMMLEWAFNTQLYKASTITKMMKGFEDLIRTVSKNPSILLRDLKIADSVSSAECIQLNGNYLDYPKDVSVCHIISKKASKQPDKIGVYFEEQKLTYRELNETANQLAALLMEYGIKKGDKIGIAVERSGKMVIVLLAIMKAGAVYVPIDPEYPVNRIEFMLEDSSPAAVLISKRFKGSFRNARKEIVIDDLWPKLTKYSKKDFSVSVQGQDLVYILYTSGSTGKPKGVKITHQNLLNCLFGLQKILSVKEDDRMMGLTTLSFDPSNIEIYLPLISSAAVTIISSQSARDSHLLLESIQSIRPSIMQATPATWQMLLDAGWDEKICIKTICSGGEALTKDLAAKLIRRSENLYNQYGPTETTICSTIKKITRPDEIITIGHPIPNTQVYILDENLRPLEQNCIGEIFIAGDGVSQGYWMRPELTVERFIQNPFSEKSGDRMYRTGDMGIRLITGEIQYMGRSDDQIKIRGHRIEPGEIEYCLMQQRDIKSCVIISREDRPGDQRLVAYVIPEQSSFPEITLQKGIRKSGVLKSDPHVKLKDQPKRVAKWKDSIGKTLPSYMVPNDFVILENLPLTLNGKIDRKGLPRPYLHDVIKKTYVAPRNNEEKLIAGIWSKLLGAEKLSVIDDFFEIGGHSFLAVQMMIQIEKQTGVRIPISVLFECSTIETLALKLRSDSKTFNWKSLVPIKSSGNKIPIYFSHDIDGRSLFLIKMSKNMHADQPIYGFQARGFDGELPFTSIEEMATHYVEEILKQNPEGPYLLAGYCYGGFIAYEMAQQLKALGKEVKMLALFDTYVSHLVSPSASRLNRIARKMTHVIMQIAFGIIFFLRDPRTKIRYEKDKGYKRARIVYRKMKRFLGIAKKDKIYSMYEIEKQNRKAVHNYKLLPYDGPIELFRCKTNTFYMDDFEYLGWRTYVKNINLHDLPGDHDRIFSYPNYYTVASTLQSCIDKAVPDKRQGVYSDNFKLKAV